MRAGRLRRRVPLRRLPPLPHRVPLQPGPQAGLREGREDVRQLLRGQMRWARGIKDTYYFNYMSLGSKQFVKEL